MPEMISKDNNDGFLIDAVKLTKKFGDITALDEVSFFLNKREVFGFLGPNGAGKTTTINILTGLSRADSGRISVAGLDCTKNPKAAQHLIGIVPDESNLYPELTGFDNLCFCASLYGIRKEERKKRAAELLDLFGLKQAGGRKFAGYSKGMKRKLTIAAGIIHHPQILFLDEPTTGIDVASARQIRQLISELPEKGTTIFLTTHYIEEAERLCDRIAFIVNGKIVRTDTVENLLQPVKGKQIMLLSVQGAAGKASAVLADAFPDFNFQYVSTDQIRIEAGTDIHLAPFVRLLDEHGIELNEAKRQVPTLEDIFVNVTGIEAKILRKESDKKRGQA